ncbi:unnamed protein product [Spodoptera littoralis]|uniref:Uncharacterized protein n=1 Tax=Spodoptera littoralis TaxID=7109 RepID=A0A9P0MYL2_SPOLI|nr:unnamed protein product [Spodoptera littoralis]CAH1638147.1 unnamed protein product [Spodoptera littoralis]
MEKVDCTFYFEDSSTNRKKLFEEALLHAKTGKVLYISSEELTELPELSQDLRSLNKYYMKMIIFMYVKSLDALIEIISSLHDWQNIPSVIILDDLSAYCDKTKLQNACGVVALLLDTTRCCSKLNNSCSLRIAVPRIVVGEDYCSILRDMYSCNESDTV